MTGGEVSRLAALERTLAGAAARQAQRRRQRRRRIAVLLAVAAPLVLAAAASVASTQGFFGVDQQFASLRDDRLIPSTPPSAAFSDALGARPRDRSSERAWMIGGQRVAGYTTANGRFCFRFGSLTGGCLRPGWLTPANPVEFTVDYGPAVFRVYGLAIDDVTAVSLRVRGVTRPVLLVRNAVYFADGALGGRRGFTGTLIVRLRGGAIRRMPVQVEGRSPAHKFVPIFPGAMPVGDAAA